MACVREAMRVGRGGLPPCGVFGSKKNPQPDRVRGAMLHRAPLKFQAGDEGGCDRGGEGRIHRADRSGRSWGGGVEGEGLRRTGCSPPSAVLGPHCPAVFPRVQGGAQRCGTGRSNTDMRSLEFQLHHFAGCSFYAQHVTGDAPHFPIIEVTFRLVSTLHPANPELYMSEFHNITDYPHRGKRLNS
jgi:hypothetical protein